MHFSLITKSSLRIGWRLIIIFVGPIWCYVIPQWCNPSVVKLFNVQIPTGDSDNERIEKSEKYLSSYKSSTSLQQLEIHTVVFGIVTKSRNYPGGTSLKYLTQTVGYLLKEIMDSNLDYQLIICNVDPVPESFHEVKNLKEKYGLKVIVANGNKNSMIFEAEKNDYAICLQNISKISSKFFVIFEDDTLVNQGLFRTGLLDIID